MEQSIWKDLISTLINAGAAAVLLALLLRYITGSLIPSLQKENRENREAFERAVNVFEQTSRSLATLTADSTKAIIQKLDDICKTQVDIYKEVRLK